MYLLGNIDVIVQIQLETQVVPPTYAMVCFTDRVLVDHFIKWSVELIVNQINYSVIKKKSMI